MAVQHIDDAFRTYELPPEGFDPLTAPADQLRRYGLPRRPDPRSEPELTRLFQRAFSRPRSFLTPELVADPTIARLRSQRRAASEFTGGDWGGAVVTTPSDQPPNLVYAQFAVPTVIAIDPELTDDLVVGFWVGIGGYGNDTLLQAGIGATVTPIPSPVPTGLATVSYWGWTEWTPAGYKVNNFDVSAGDVVSVLVCAPEPDHGFVMLENLRTDQIVSVGVSPGTSGEIANGPSAEWIIEALSQDTPAFTPVTFANCIAGSQNTTLSVSGATTLDMPGPDGNEVTTTITSGSSVTIQWDAFL